MWDLPGPGLEPMAPALAGGFLTTEPRGKPERSFQPVKSAKPQLPGSRCAPLQPLHQKLPSLCFPTVQASRAPVNAPSALVHPLWPLRTPSTTAVSFHHINPSGLPSPFLPAAFFFWLHRVFVAAHRLSLAVASGGYSLLRCAGFSLQWLLLLRCVGFSSCGTQAQ